MLYRYFHFNMKAFVIIFLSIFLYSSVCASEINGLVVGVADGDTITVLQNNTQYKIRLYGIDCPENGQDFGQKAKKFVSELVFKKNARVIPTTIDKYGRTVGLVTVNGINVNEQIIKNGYGWVYLKYCDQSFCNDWIKYESQAKLKKLGLWSHYNPMPPWEYRHKGKEKLLAKSSSEFSQFHGNRNSHVFHSQYCEHFNCKNCTVSFNSSAQAVSSGYRACRKCKP